MSRRAPASSRLTATDYMKIVAITFSIFGVIFGCCFALYILVTLPCGNNVVDEVYSPNHQYKVVIFESGCGVNSTDFINAAILKATQKLSNSDVDFFRVNILMADVRDTGEIQAIWIDNRSIQITFSHPTKIYIQETIYLQERKYNYFNQIFTVYYEEEK